jgi:iron complex outermembrane recepter protein
MIPRRYFVSLAAILPWLSPWAFADSSDTKLEEIVVTAQKREQSFNDVGIAVSVLSSADIADAGIKTLVDVASQTPNLQMKNVLGNSITNVSIRGIGLNDYAVNNNPAAGIYVDNVYLVSPAMLTFGLFDIDRIEVLKGPQGDLYGRNTTAGAINFVSRKPSAATDLEMEAGYGNYENWHFNGAVGGAIAPDLTGRFSLQTVQQDSGWQTNYLTGRKVGKIDRTAARLQLDWKPNDDVNVLFSAHAGYDRSDVDLIKVVNVTTSLGSQYANQPYVSGASNNPHMNLESGGASVAVDWTLMQDLTLTSISAYEHFTRLHVEDRDGTALRQLDGTFDNHVDQYSEELRLTYLKNDLALIGGAFYSQDVVKDLDSYDAPDLLSLLGLAGLDTIGNAYRQRTETYAGFLHGEWTFAPQWTLVGGVRFTDEHKKFDQATTFLGAGGVDNDVFAPVTNYFSTSNTSGKIGLNYKVLDQTLIYASVSRGFKSGGFQGQLTFDPTDLKPFRNETLTAYELGIKSRILQNTLQVNAAVFDYDYRDMQFYGPLFTSPVGVLFGIANVGNARVRGAEADAWWRATAGLDLRFGVGTIDTKITKSVVDGVTTGSNLPNAPKLTLNGMVRYQWALNNRLSADVVVSGNYQSNLAFDVVRNPPEALAGGYFLANAELGVSPSDQWRVWLWGKNLFNRLYETEALYSSVGWGYDYGPPRTYGINFSYKL